MRNLDYSRLHHAKNLPRLLAIKQAIYELGDQPHSPLRVAQRRHPQAHGRNPNRNQRRLRV
jgi:hypothetical protein